MPEADGEVVWSWRLDAGVKFAEVVFAGDGDKPARSPGRARRKPLKPSACGNAGLFRCTRGDYARVLCFISHARLRVHWAPGIPHALEGRRNRQTSGGCRRENANPCLRNDDLNTGCLKNRIHSRTRPFRSLPPCGGGRGRGWRHRDCVRWRDDDRDCPCGPLSPTPRASFARLDPTRGAGVHCRCRAIRARPA